MFEGIFGGKKAEDLKGCPNAEGGASTEGVEKSKMKCPLCKSETIIPHMVRSLKRAPVPDYFICSSCGVIFVETKDNYWTY